MPPLCHQDQRSLALAHVAVLVANAEFDACHDVLYHRVDRNWKLADGTERQPAATGLVTGELRPVDEENRCTGACEAVGGHGAGWAGPNDDDVVVSHVARRVGSVATRRPVPPWPAIAAAPPFAVALAGSRRWNVLCLLH